MGLDPAESLIWRELSLIDLSGHSLEEPSQPSCLTSLVFIGLDLDLSYCKQSILWGIC